METNQPFQIFNQAIHQALTHLFDPDYTAPSVLLNRIHNETVQSQTLQSYLLQEIQKLKPDPEQDTNTRRQRSYTILTLRFIDGLSQEQTAERLEMSLRSLQRAQQQAILILAYSLWNQSGSEVSPGSDVWRSQLGQELTNLSQKNPAHAELNAVLHKVKRITSARSPRRFDLSIAIDNPLLPTPFHPSVLQQIILSALDSIMEAAPVDVVDIRVQTQGDQATQVRMTGGPSRMTQDPELSLIKRLLAVQEGCSLAVTSYDPYILDMMIPLVESRHQHKSVFFVDDNADLAALYKTYCTGTAYDLVHINQGLVAMERITEQQPDLIVLDVMLPDIDGWELLMLLQANPVTAAIPVIVCSVVTDPQLALDLGALIYLQKPVWRQQFLDALQSALDSEA